MPLPPRRLVGAALAASTALLSVTAVTGSASATSGGGAQDPFALSLADHGSVNAGAQHLTEPDASVPLDPASGLPLGVPASGSYTFLVTLRTTPAMSTFASARSKGMTAKAAGQAAVTQKAAIATAQSRLAQALPARSSVLYRLSNVLDAVAVRTDVHNYTALTHLAGVAAVYPVAPKAPTNSYAVPFQDAPAGWDGDPSGKDIGEGIRVADIDTGLDYTHADFGGPGTTAAYRTAFAHDTEAPAAGSYDPHKFDAQDSWDLVGDTYNADSTGQSGAYQPVPQPDPNPLDCDPADGGDGHGSHTAGSIGGFGVNADGTTYGVQADGSVDGSAYSASTDFAAMRVGPGMAPGATLISYRVFGCEGTSDVISKAIDMAMDPNQDGSPADHVDVINLSLGSDFGAADDGDSIAAEAAVDAGVTVAVASGNAGDVPDIGGSPGDAPKVLTVAASEDAQSIVDGTVATAAGQPLQVDGGPLPTERSLSYQWGDPAAVGGGDLSGELVAAPSDDATGCQAFSAADQAAIAGKVVFLTWTDDNLECGSAVRGANVRAAGGVGFVFGSNLPELDGAITGDQGPQQPDGSYDAAAAIPGIEVNSEASTVIRNAFAADQAVQISGTRTSVVTQSYPDDNDKVASFSSRGVRAAGDAKPDVSAVGTTVFSALAGSGGDGQTLSGTSMATPMVAGLAALVIEAHPGWTPEQVKADIMNTADADLYAGGSADPSSPRYAPNRVGAGRIDAGTAIPNQVVAFDGDDAGTVSASFGTIEVPMTQSSPYVATKTIKVQNSGDTDADYTVSYDEIHGMQGVDYKLSTDGADGTPGTLLVPAHTTRQVVVTLEIDDPTALEKDVDPSYQHKVDGVFYNSAATDGSGTPTGVAVETVADASGNLTLTPVVASPSTPALRVPVYSSPRPAAAMNVPSTVTLDGDGQAALQPWGAGIAAGQLADASTRIFSLAAGFELQATSGLAPECSSGAAGPCVSLPEDRAADLKYVGTTSDYPLYQQQPGACVDSQQRQADPATCAMAYFDVTAQGAASSPVGRAEYDLYIDTNDDGQADLAVYNTALGLAADSAQPVYVAEVVDLDDPAGPTVVDDEPLYGRFGATDVAAYDSDTTVLPVALSVLAKYGISPSNPTIHYGIESVGYDSASLVDSVGIDPQTGDMRSAIPMNVYQPAISVSETDGTSTWGPLVDDQDTAALDSVHLSLELTRNAASYAADGGKGLLYVHFHNGVGDKAQVVQLATAAPKAATVTLTAAAPSVVVGGSDLLTAQVGGPSSADLPTGTVTFAAAGRTLGTVPLTAGVAQLLYRPTVAGPVTVTASYAGDDDFAPATSSALPLTVTGSGSTTTPPPAKSPAAVTLTAKKSVKKGRKVAVKVAVAVVRGVAPTGTVTVKVGRKTLTATLAGGKATVRAKAAKRGRLKISALYLGDAHYRAGASRTITVKVR
jgi:subtilisin family serine protease